MHGIQNKDLHSLQLTKVVYAVTGSLDVAARAMEVDCAKAAMHMLVEKPISMRPAEEVERLAQVTLVCNHIKGAHP